jgi:FAD/FMN-containing dehydrogenase
MGSSNDPDVVAAAALALSQAPLELEALDVAWRAGRGGILARTAGAEAARRTQRVAQLLLELGLEQVDTTSDDEALWARQRAGQRSHGERSLVRLAARPSALAAVLRAVEACGGTLVGRAALGTSYVELEPRAVGLLRDHLAPGTFSVVLDAPAEFRDELDRWGPTDRSALELMRRVKARFDPARACNPGVFAGGI